VVIALWIGKVISVNVEVLIDATIVIGVVVLLLDPIPGDELIVVWWGEH